MLPVPILTSPSNPNNAVPVLNAVLSVPLPAVVSLAPPPPPEPNSKRYVIIHTTAIPAVDLANFQSYGVVCEYKQEIEGSIGVDNLQFDYLFINLKTKAGRQYFDNSNLDNYNVIAYISFLEKYDAFIENLGANYIMSSFPAKQHYKSSFDSLLVQGDPTGAPNACLSCLNYGSSFLGSLKASGVKL